MNVIRCECRGELISVEAFDDSYSDLYSLNWWVNHPNFRQPWYKRLFLAYGVLINNPVGYMEVILNKEETTKLKDELDNVLGESSQGPDTLLQ